MKVISVCYQDTIRIQYSRMFHINEMITGMLSYMRLEKAPDIKNEDIALNKLIGQVVDRYRVELENRDIECEISGNAVIHLSCGSR